MFCCASWLNEYINYVNRLFLSTIITHMTLIVSVYGPGVTYDMRLFK